jgi:2'-5' RNA ligase
MKRIFLALRLNEIAISLLKNLGGTAPGARPVPAEQIHLTMRFIGEVDGTVFKDIRERLLDLDSPVVTLAVKGVGHFPPRGAPRVLWAGIAPSAELMMLRNRINSLLRQCGIDHDPRKFHPHVTLARLKNTSAAKVAKFLTENHDLAVPPFRVNELTLFSSILSSKGAVHNVENRYPLRNAE